MTPNKPTVVLGGLALCAALGLALTGTWAHGVAEGVGGVGGQELSLSGTEASPWPRPALLCAAAALLAAAFVGPVARRVAGLVLVLSGLGMVAAAIGVLRDPAGPVAARVAEAWGLGEASAVTVDAAAGWLPWTGVLGGALLAALGGVVLVARWEGLGATYDREQTRDTQDEPLWDSLTRGEDPT
ncbi:Tryptophan-associated transmembrane protein (Trp_oprn_chp) [Kytococcus aerolatus]|uniref:Tryptophan-associated transmembrane protein (Trp_oprn_chp) n=1 Tax=Kytococcus aerolatus TaxID=592308 RepID=A0A212T028_9MICO|nr:Trp biosynthesis-associated membrane protein [Kytococcus aerolatus]SNC59365.1 Tryptophan-associated transmembrane protein (Trp_oprn_chp) [Kytococcus aerolatus]